MHVTSINCKNWQINSDIFPYYLELNKAGLSNKTILFISINDSYIIAGEIIPLSHLSWTVRFPLVMIHGVTQFYASKYIIYLNT